MISKVGTTKASWRVIYCWKGFNLYFHCRTKLFMLILKVLYKPMALISKGYSLRLIGATCMLIKRKLYAKDLKTSSLFNTSISTSWIQYQCSSENVYSAPIFCLSALLGMVALHYKALFWTALFNCCTLSTKNGTLKNRCFQDDSSCIKIDRQSRMLLQLSRSLVH